MTTKYSIRTDEQTGKFIQTCYNLYRTEATESRERPVSLNRFLVSLIVEALKGDTPLRIQ